MRGDGTEVELDPRSDCGGRGRLRRRGAERHDEENEQDEGPAFQRVANLNSARGRRRLAARWQSETVRSEKPLAAPHIEKARTPL